MEDTHRLTADFSEGAYADLDALASEQGKTKAQILRDALALEKWFQETKREGGRILVERDGKVREIIPR